MNWSHVFRQAHRWFAVLFTLGFIANSVAILLKKYSPAVGFLAIVPIFLLFFSGLYLFALPYVLKWRSARRAKNPAI